MLSFGYAALNQNLECLFGYAGKRGTPRPYTVDCHLIKLSMRPYTADCHPIKLPMHPYACVALFFVVKAIQSPFGYIVGYII